MIAYARKVLGLDQHDDRSESPQIEADMEPPPIGTPLGKAQAIRLIKSNPKSNALKRDRQGKKFGYFIERPPMGGNQEMLFTSTMPTHTKKNGALVGMPPPANCMQQIGTDALPVFLPGPRLRTHPVCVAGSALYTICYYCRYCRLLLPLTLPIAVVAMG